MCDSQPCFLVGGFLFFTAVFFPFSLVPLPVNVDVALQLSLHKWCAPQGKVLFWAYPHGSLGDCDEKDFPGERKTFQFVIKFNVSQHENYHQRDMVALFKPDSSFYRN